MTKRSCRLGFTLLELIVVTAIICLLASLAMWAVMPARTVADNLEDYRELVGLHAALESFCRDDRLGKVGYLPSKLDPSGGDPMSQQYIRKLFPHTGGGLRLAKAQLEGSQVLVLMLGGPDNKGWATDPLDPTASYGMRIKFYEFDEKRLKDVHGTGFKSYLDRHGTAIAYFCPRRESIDWNTSYTDDNPTLGVSPYTNINLNTFQLISAGPDKKFGTKGATWTPDSGPSVYPRQDFGNDDVANFSKRLGGRQ